MRVCQKHSTLDYSNWNTTLSVDEILCVLGIVTVCCSPQVVWSSMSTAAKIFPQNDELWVEFYAFADAHENYQDVKAIRCRK